MSVASDPLFGSIHGPRILIYHQVGMNLGREMEVSTESFAKQIEWMQLNGEIVDLKTAIDRWNRPRSDRLFVLTFDDGFEDVHRNAFPLMREREIPFTLYLTTRPIETGEPLDAGYPSAKPLRWDQVNEMIASGLVTVGAHTHTHPDLRSIAVSQIESELVMADETIEKRTGIGAKHFTYPWGLWSAHADRLVRDRYESATVGSSLANSPIDYYRLGRLPVQRSDGMRMFQRRMKGGLRLEARAREARDRLRG